MNQSISIIGAGLVGALLAILLKKEKHEIHLFEKRQDPRKTDQYAGRSINLALSYRGIKALESAGVWNKVMPYLMPMKGRMIHDINGNQTFQPYGRSGEVINSISRGKLNALLVDIAEKNGVTFHFGQTAKNINIFTPSLITLDSKKKFPDLLIGTDGVNSTVRKCFEDLNGFSVNCQHIQHGYKELQIEPVNGNFGFNPECLHIWPRGNFMLIALPNIDKSFTCTLFLPIKGTYPSFETLSSSQKIISFFKQFFPCAVSLLPHLVEQFTHNPTSYLSNIECSPWHTDRSILIGDAAHAMMPFYGQGMNSGFEDAELLLTMGKSMNLQWEKVLPAFFKSRKEDTDAITNMSLDNFFEMRDLVGNKDFLHSKALEMRIQEAYPDEWRTLYGMVTFTDIPYSKAQKIGVIQKKLMHQFEQGKFKNIFSMIEKYRDLKIDIESQQVSILNK